ncbi:MAG: gamma-glutamyl-gamma-aminobutyrate hydrolase family protein [Chloroflexi bacterium]|nr:MAG: gamma-glutamyl-gamma-aminobutyrate hydrolase family protein [Chloroflexota bacterium]
MSAYCPIIGIPCRLDTSGLYPGRPVDAQNTAYTRAVIESGGIPILIPVEVNGVMLDTLFNRVDGILFSGGGDIDPAYYNQPHLVDNLSDIQQIRDEHELRLIRMAIDKGKPFLAICRGMQVMNVATGGTLYQDLATQNPNTIRHDFYYSDEQLPRNYIAHNVQLEKSSRLYNILQSDRVPVNSLHHQAIREVGSTVQVTGRAEDGVVEVLEIKDHPFALGVQWHPEELYSESAEARKLFDAFVGVSRNGHGK